MMIRNHYEEEHEAFRDAFRTFIEREAVPNECLQLHGSAGYMQEYPICQLYQDARIFRIFAGTSEVMKIVIAKDMLGR